MTGKTNVALAGSATTQRQCSKDEERGKEGRLYVFQLTCLSAWDKLRNRALMDLPDAQ